MQKAGGLCVRSVPAKWLPPSTPPTSALSSTKEKTAIKAVLSFVVEVVLFAETLKREPSAKCRRADMLTEERYSRLRTLLA